MPNKYKQAARDRGRKPVMVWLTRQATEALESIKKKKEDWNTTDAISNSLVYLDQKMK